MIPFGKIFKKVKSDPTVGRRQTFKSLTGMLKYQVSKQADTNKGWVGEIQALLQDNFIISKDPTDKSNKTLKLNRWLKIKSETTQEQKQYHQQMPLFVRKATDWNHMENSEVFSMSSKRPSSASATKSAQSQPVGQ